MTQIVSDDALAEARASVMWANDHAGRALGIKIDQVGPGWARVSMTVCKEMLNGYGRCHGGLISSLADSAFALACNSRGTVTVGSGFEVDFLEPGRAGEVPWPRPARSSSAAALASTTSVRQGDTVIAEFRGRSRSLGRPILEEEEG